MPKENNKMQVDIDTLKKQNVNDLLSIKELYSKLEELGEKITQVKYIDNTLVKKLKKEYENLKKIILDENVQLKLTNDIETINSHLDNNVQQINDIKNPNYNEKKPYCVFIDDDGRIEFLTKLKPIFDKKGIKCNIAVQTSRVGSESKYLSWNAINELSREGYEICSHGHEHKKIGNITDDEALFELKESKRILNEKGYKARAFVYGDGCEYSDTRARELVKKYYECGIATQHGKSNIYPLDSFCMSRWSITRPLTELKNKVDLCESEKNVTIFMCHAWDPALTTEKLSEIEELIDYIKSKNIEIITLEQMLDKVGNVIEIGNPNTPTRYAVSKTGVTVSDRSDVESSNTSTFSVYHRNGTNFEKPITEYEKGIIYESWSTSLSSTSPTKTKGTTIIYNIFNTHIYNYEEFIPCNTNEKYMRKPSSDGLTWGNWDKI